MSMVNLRNRIKRLERQQPDWIELLSDEELHALLDAERERIKNDPEMQAWLADDSCNDPLRLEMLEALKRDNERML